jgi:hypothetical protein
MRREPSANVGALALHTSFLPMNRRSHAGSAHCEGSIPASAAGSSVLAGRARRGGA